MADITLAAHSAFPVGMKLRSKSVAIEVCDDLAIVGLTAYRGTADALAGAIAERFSIALPSPGKRVGTDRISFMWTGCHQWLAIAARAEGGLDLEAELAAATAGLCSIVDHADARAVLTIAGSDARAVLAKGLPIDLDERVFKPGDAAVTHANHIGLTIAQLDATPTYEISIPRSLASSFADWLRHAATEFLD